MIIYIYGLQCDILLEMHIIEDPVRVVGTSSSLSVHYGRILWCVFSSSSLLHIHIYAVVALLWFKTLDFISSIQLIKGTCYSTSFHPLCPLGLLTCSTYTKTFPKSPCNASLIFQYFPFITQGFPQLHLFS